MKPASLAALLSAIMLTILSSCGPDTPAPAPTPAESNTTRSPSPKLPAESNTTRSPSPQLPALTFPHATTAQKSSVLQATTFADIRKALMATYPSITDVKWYMPTKDDPKSEIEISFRNTAGLTWPEKRNELASIMREMMPLMLTLKNGWGVINFNNGAILIVDRQLAVGVDFSTATYDELQSLSNRSVLH